MSIQRLAKSDGVVGRWLVCLAGLVMGCAAGQADVVVLRDGSELSGKVISRDDLAIVVRVAIAGGTIQRTFKATDVKEIRPDGAATGITWLEIPIFGEIGPEVTADGVSKALAAARRLKVQRVVVLIDSPGGQVSEQMAICDALLGAQDLKPVAFVKHAYSAAALIAAACPTIVMHPDGQIGGAVVIYPADKANPLPRPVEEKYLSVILARDRMIAERAGHDPLFVDAMSDVGAEISMQVAGGRVRLWPGEAPGAKVLKAKGSILTMTAREALSAGLSAGTLSTMAELGALLGYTGDQWHSAGRQGWTIMKASAESVRTRESETRRATEGAQAAAEIEKRLAALQTALQAIDIAGQEARSQLEREQQAVQYTGAAYSRELYTQKQAEVQARYERTMADLEKKRRAMEKEIAELRSLKIQ